MNPSIGVTPTSPAVPVASVRTNDGTRVRATFGWGSPGQPIVKLTTKGMGVAQVPAKKDKTTLLYMMPNSGNKGFGPA